MPIKFIQNLAESLQDLEVDDPAALKSTLEHIMEAMAKILVVRL